MPTHPSTNLLKVKQIPIQATPNFSGKKKKKILG